MSKRATEQETVWDRWKRRILNTKVGAFVVLCAIVVTFFGGPKAFYEFLSGNGGRSGQEEPPPRLDSSSPEDGSTLLPGQIVDFNLKFDQELSNGMIGGRPAKLAPSSQNKNLRAQLAVPGNADSWKVPWIAYGRTNQRGDGILSFSVDGRIGETRDMDTVGHDVNGSKELATLIQAPCKFQSTVGWRHEGESDKADWYTFRLARKVRYQVTLKNMAPVQQDFVFLDALQVFSARSATPVAAGKEAHLGATVSDSTEWFRADAGEVFWVRIMPARGVEYNGVRYELELRVQE
jgi:hypothetical protein